VRHVALFLNTEKESPRMGQRRTRDKTTPPRLTERQAYWLEHLRACETSGLTAKAYAKKHRLSIHALYQAGKERRRRDALASPRKRRSVTFAKVHAAPVAIQGGSWRVRLPNGAVIELEAPREPEDRVHLLQSVACLS
jgi:hypothetical protein